MANWYCGSTKWTAVTAWAASTAYVVGDLRRQLATPALNNERVFRCTTEGTSGVTEPVWQVGEGLTTTDNTVVWTEVTGIETYGWNASHARLASAFNWCAAGDTIWVSNNHAETQPSSLTIPANMGTVQSPIIVLCVEDTSTPPTTLATTGIITTTGASNITIESGFVYFYGITFNCGSGASAVYFYIGLSNTPSGLQFSNCNINLISTGASIIRLGPAVATLNDDCCFSLYNTNMQFAAVGQTVSLRYGNFLWSGGTVTGTVFPTTLITPAISCSSTCVLNGCDLSPLGSNNIVSGSVACADIILGKNCKLSTNAVVVTGTIPGPGGIKVFFDNCDSADTNYRFEHYKYQGSIKQAINCYLNAAYSMKMVSITGVSYISPLESPPIAQWNSSVGSAKTATVEIIHNESADLNDNEIWVELEYLGTTGFPLASFVNDKMAWFGTPTAQTTSTATWVEDLTGERKQKLSVSFTPQKAGYIVARVYLGKVTTNPVYIDPYITVS